MHFKSSSYIVYNYIQNKLLKKKCNSFNHLQVKLYKKKIELGGCQHNFFVFSLEHTRNIDKTLSSKIVFHAF